MAPAGGKSLERSVDSHRIEIGPRGGREGQAGSLDIDMSRGLSFRERIAGIHGSRMKRDTREIL